MTAADACEPCAGPRRGVYRTTCLGCCLELLRQAPAGMHRRAVAVHLAATIEDGEHWQRVLDAAKSEGLTR